MKNALKITTVIIGTIIGGGFISGQEIYVFFNKYGSAGVLGIIISMLLISFIIYKTYKIANENNINTYEEFLNRIIPGENEFLKETIKNIINIFLMLLFFIMCNAFSTYCHRIYNIPPILGGILISILAYFILIKDVKAIIKTNEILMPLIILFIIFMAILFLKKINTGISIGNNAIIKGVLYANYNCITIIPIIVNLKNQIKNKKQMKLISIITFGIMLILSFLIYEMQESVGVEEAKMPLLGVAKQISNTCLFIYGVATQIAIFTSAIAAGYSLKCNINKHNKTVILLLCMLSIPFNMLEFEHLVNLIYPIFGVLGILQIFFVIKA